MIFIPAIDLKNGRCVRLLQGDERKEKVYFSDPCDAAKWFMDGGAEIIHVVDLDGAIKGNQENMRVVEKIMKLGLKVQLGGGIRSYESGKAWLSMGVDRIIVSTMLCENPSDFLKLSQDYPGRVWFGLDVRDGMFVVRGWKEGSGIHVFEAASRALDLGAGGIVYTDVKRDGMETGPNFDEAYEIMRRFKVPVILSGGVRDLSDIRKAKRMGFYGIIVGKALYERRFKISDAVSISRDG